MDPGDLTEAGPSGLQDDMRRVLGEYSPTDQRGGGLATGE